MRRLNVSLDSLSHTRFAEITRRDALGPVLAGLAEAERHPELQPITVNCVAIRGFTEHELAALAAVARDRPYVVRLIEFMALDADRAWRPDQVLTGAEIRALIERRAVVELPTPPSSTARRFRFADGADEIGFVSPISEAFCSSCDRIPRHRRRATTHVPVLAPGMGPARAAPQRRQRRRARNAPARRDRAQGAQAPHQRRRPPCRAWATSPRASLQESSGARFRLGPRLRSRHRRWDLSADHRGLARHRDGEISRARIAPADRAGMRRFAGRFRDQELEVALEARTGWRFVVEELRAIGARVHLAEPAETAARRGTKERAKSDRADARHLRELVMVDRLPESWVPPGHLLDLRARVRLRHTLVDARREWHSACTRCSITTASHRAAG